MGLFDLLRKLRLQDRRVADNFGPIDEMLRLLLETKEHRFVVDREGHRALFTRGGMQAVASEVKSRLIRVTYESAPHEVVEEFCTTPEQAAVLINAVMARKQLCRVPRPDCN